MSVILGEKTWKTDRINIKVDAIENAVVRRKFNGSSSVEKKKVHIELSFFRVSYINQAVRWKKEVL